MINRVKSQKLVKCGNDNCKQLVQGLCQQGELPYRRLCRHCLEKHIEDKYVSPKPKKKPSRNIPKMVEDNNDYLDMLQRLKGRS